MCRLHTVLDRDKKRNAHMKARMLVPIFKTILALGILPIAWFDHERVPWFIWAAIVTCACLLLIADGWGTWARSEIRRDAEHPAA